MKKPTEIEDTWGRIVRRRAEGLGWDTVRLYLPLNTPIFADALDYTAQVWENEKKTNKKIDF